MATSILQGATGKGAAQYYASAARIMAESADREAQIMASQSAIAMNAVTGLTQSLTQGFMKAMEYSLAVKQADYDREMQLRNFQLQEEQREMQRLQAQELVLNGQIDRKHKLMQLAQMQQDRDNASWKKMALAQASGQVSEIVTAAMEYETGIGGQESLDRVVELYRRLPDIKRQALMRGVSPEEFAAMETQLAPLVQKLSFVSVNGREMRRADYQKQAYNLASPSGKQILVAAIDGTGPHDRLVNGEVAPWTEYLLSRNAAIMADKTSDFDAIAKKMLADNGISEPAPDQLKRAVALVRSFKTMDDEGRAELYVKTKMVTDAAFAERLQRERQLPGFDQRSMTSIAASIDPSWGPKTAAAGGQAGAASGWQPGVLDNSEKFVRQTIRGGTREVETSTLVRMARNNQQLDAVANSDNEKLIAGDFSAFDYTGIADRGALAFPALAAIGRGTMAVYGEARSAWRTAAPEEEQAAASEILHEQLRWALSASNPQQAVARLESAKAFVNAYKKDYVERTGKTPTSFELLTGSEFAFKKLAENFKNAGSTSGKAQLSSLLASFDYATDRYSELSRTLAAPSRSASAILGIAQGGAGAAPIPTPTPPLAVLAPPPTP